MNVLLIALFIFIAVIAAGFAVLPLLRRVQGRAPRQRYQFGVAALVALLVIGMGLGAYFALGQPQLALRALSGPQVDDFRGLVATLAARIRERPDDAQGWALLGRGYLALGNPDEAAKALSRAIALDRAKGAVPASLYSAYGEALTGSTGGAVPAEAETAFRAALAADPKEPGARYYLGLAARARGDKAAALYYWEGLLSDAPLGASWRGILVDEVAALKAEQVQAGTSAAPDISTMVQGLAARLAAQPNDLEGWLRLIRAYAVMGEADKAKTSLARARGIFVKDARAQGALTALAQELALKGN
jgi:cytochrome c-type biogenesis protein CcmH